LYRVGSGAGFSGDRVDAAILVVAAIAAQGEGGAVIFETIGERTLALGQLAWRENARAGYGPLPAEFLAPILVPAVAAAIIIVGHFGCANLVAAVVGGLARRAGLPPLRIALVEGDDVTHTIDLATAPVWEVERGLTPPTGALISACGRSVRRTRRGTARLPRARQGPAAGGLPAWRCGNLHAQTADRGPAWQCAARRARR
jgi:hypothetical protein